MREARLFNDNLRTNYSESMCSSVHMSTTGPSLTYRHRVNMHRTRRASSKGNPKTASAYGYQLHLQILYNLILSKNILLIYYYIDIIIELLLISAMYRINLYFDCQENVLVLHALMSGFSLNSLMISYSAAARACRRWQTI